MFIATRARSIQDLAPRASHGSSTILDSEAPIASTTGAEVDEGRMAGCEWRVGLDGRMELGGCSRAFALPQERYERLHAYQRAGVAWMAQLFLAEHGGILADEMGLGKTVQVCSFLDGVRLAGAKRVLILLPVTLVEQWRAEAHVWCPGWEVFVYHGTAAQRAKALQGIRQVSGGILITSYSLFSNNSRHLNQVNASQLSKNAQPKCRPTKRQRLTDEGDWDTLDELDCDLMPVDIAADDWLTPWDIVICDEAHKMKNISTLLGKSLRSIHARCRLLLTGTPVQNSLQDLWALMDFAQQGLLGNQRTFVKNFSDPINCGSVRGASSYAIGLKKHLSEELWRLVSPHLLRRTKMSVGLLADGDVGEPDADLCSAVERSSPHALPAKFETVLWLMPSDVQVQAYRMVLDQSDLVRRVASKSKLSIDVFQVIGLLKRLCNHPLLALRTSDPKVWEELLAQARNQFATLAAQGTDVHKLETLGETGACGVGMPPDEPVLVCPQVEALARSLPLNVEALLEQSAKLRCLAMLLPALAAKGHRSLIFAQGVKMLDLIELCVLKGLGFKHLRMDGKTSVAARASVVKQFQTERDQFQFLLLTTSVGGVGLNLTGADRVVLVDPAWNPQTDAQAVDRVFRIGQDREVRVYRLVMSGLIEDKMFRLQVFKMGLMRTALEAKPQQHYFTAREIRGLFDWTDPAEGETWKLLVDGHGDASEESTACHARGDGIDEDFVQRAGIVALSNFSALFKSLLRSDEGDECSAQIVEMKKQLEDSDSRIEQVVEMQQVAEGSLDVKKKEFDEASQRILSISASRSKMDDHLAVKRLELAKIKRMQLAAEQRLKKAELARELAQAAQDRVDRSRRKAETNQASFELIASQAREAMLAAEEVLPEATHNVRQMLAWVDCNGSAAADSNKDACAAGLQVTKQVFHEACEAFQVVNATQVELQLALNEEKSSPEAVQTRVVRAQEDASNCVRVLLEAGEAFVKSFHRAAACRVAASRVLSAQEEAIAAFTQLRNAWEAARTLQEAWLRAVISRRELLRKAVLATAAAAMASDQLAEADALVEEAAADEALRRVRCEAREAETMAAEVAKGEADALENQWRRRRDELRAGLGIAHLDSLKSRAAALKATEQRSALQAWCARAENLHLQLEASKVSAVEALTAETYNEKQVEEAYEARKRQRHES